MWVDPACYDPLTSLIHIFVQLNKNMVNDKLKTCTGTAWRQKSAPKKAVFAFVVAMTFSGSLCVGKYLLQTNKKKKRSFKQYLINLI